MIIKLEDQYRQKLRDWLVYAGASVVLMQRGDTTMSLEDKASLIDKLDRSIPDVRRILMFLINTRKGN